MPHLPFAPLPVACFFLASAAQAQVFVRGDGEGQGILRPRGGECYILTPKHVVVLSSEVSIVAEFRREAKARVETMYEEDLAVLRVDDTTPISCTEAWDGARRLQDRLGALPEGVLETRNETGSLERRFVRVSSHDPRYITIRPVGPQDALFPKLSGSLLRIGGTPAGILLRVDTTGGAIVLRADHMTDLTRSFFDVPFEEKAVAADGFTIDPMDARYLVAESTSLFTKPDQLAATVRALDVGALLRVTGRVRERLWYRVTIADGTVGFVPTRVLQKF